MLPLKDWPAEDRAAIRGVFTDIDDTLTTDGAITADALQALAALRDAGLPVIAITGRSVGWSLPFAAAWPVSAIVAENGAVALLPGDPPQRRYLQEATLRARHFERLQQVAVRVLREVPGARLAQDTPGRETDIAIDHAEFNHMTPQAVAQAVAILHAEGLHATVSSIHINAWLGDHDKMVGARWAVRLLFGRELDAEAAQWVAVGDSANDQVLFAALPHTVGVANIRQVAATLRHPPRFVTTAERGAGFAEMARRLLSARGG